jgi:hypothetical protein
MGAFNSKVYDEEIRGVGTALQELRAQAADQIPKIHEVQRLLDFAE